MVSLAYIKAKARDGENAVVAYLRKRGFKQVERRRLKGSKDQGDIAGIPGVVIEVKAVKEIRHAEFVGELEAEIDNADADTGAVYIKKRGTTDVGGWYALMPVSRHVDLLLEREQIRHDF